MMDKVFNQLPPNLQVFAPLLAALSAILVAVTVSLVLHRVAIVVLRRVASRSRVRIDDALLDHAERPTRWIALLIALGLAQRSIAFDSWALGLWRQAIGLALPAMVGWLALAVLHAVKENVDQRTDISVADNLNARRKRTRVAILSRISAVVILFLTACMMLLSIPGVRNVGVTLMASAGLAGLAVGAAAQPALKNLIAGVQMAFTEPIRIDDVVVIDGEWGRIEEIRLTYVVVRVWDERRLVVPVSKFLEESFQNWTRQSAQILGSSFIYVDPATDVDQVRAKLGELVSSNERWDGRFFNLQVTDIRPDVMELRALMTAADASQAFDLRCDIREGLMRFISSEMPKALTRKRIETVGERVA